MTKSTECDKIEKLVTAASEKTMEENGCGCLYDHCAAKRNKIKTIIIPKANQKDLEEIPENVKSGINFIPVSDVKEVLQIALGID